MDKIKIFYEGIVNEKHWVRYAWEKQNSPSAQAEEELLWKEKREREEFLCRYRSS